MKIYLSPQVNHVDKIIYSFAGDVITVNYNGEVDVFDFTLLPVGVMDSVETELPINPIIHAERKADGLYVTLLNYIDDDATHEECFPDWTEV